MTGISSTAEAAREQHRDPRGRFGAQPAPESQATLTADPDLESVHPGQHVLDYAAQYGWDEDQTRSMFADCLARAAEMEPIDPDRLARDWMSFCTGRADRALGPALAQEYRQLAEQPPPALEAMATMRMNGREYDARRSMRSLRADLSATRGVSQRVLDDYLAAARAQYQDRFADQPEDQRPHPPQEWVTGLTQRCWPQRQVPRDDATLYAFYRAEADPRAFPSRPRRFASVDLETAGPSGQLGFDPEHGCIIEVGVVRYDEDGQVVGTYSQLIHPAPGAEHTYRTGATDVHGIHWDDVADAPHWQEVVPATQQALSRATLMAHNAAFEKKWLSYHLPGFHDETPTIDTLILTQRNYGNLESHQLGAMCEHLGVEYTDGHRAEHDARVAAEMFFAVREDITSRYQDDPAFADLPDPRSSR